MFARCPAQAGRSRQEELLILWQLSFSFQDSKVERYRAVVVQKADGLLRRVVLRRPDAMAGAVGKDGVGIESYHIYALQYLQLGGTAGDCGNAVVL